MSIRRTIYRNRRVLPVVLAFCALLGIMRLKAPAFFQAQNLKDVAVNAAPALIVAVGMTLIIIVGEIDISVASQFAICSVTMGWAAKAGVPIWALPVCALGVGSVMGALNGWLVGRQGLPSIVVTLATFVAYRDALRWTTQGAWVQNLPSSFQWFGLSQRAGESLILIASFCLVIVFAIGLKYVAAGRAVYAVGSDREAARLAGIEPRNVVFAVFLMMGALTGLAALLNATRFAAVPSNLGSGLEMKAIAAVVVGGTAITGGRGNLTGSLFGIALLGSIATALVFAGINPFWEKAIQGSIILIAVFADAALGKLNRNVNYHQFGARTA